MGYRVVTKRFLNEAKSICLFEIEAPLIARHAMAGQFVIFRLDAIKVTWHRLILGFTVALKGKRHE